MTKCLFDFIGLNLNVLQDLDPNHDGITPQQKTDNARERRIRCNGGGTRLTKEFSDWWKQRKHNFFLNIDSNQFEVFVSDNIDNTEIELEERSAGFQYFFSFFIVFLVEADQKHRNSILLLDEPGLHYHGSFQLELIKFLEDLSQTNQLMYTTHSPFMIDNKIVDIKSVHEDKESGYTKISKDGEWPKDKDALFPIRVGWWYNVFNAYIQDKIHLIVEGPTDVLILNSISKELDKQSKTHLFSDILVVPGEGKKTRLLVSLLFAQDVTMILFQDSDKAGRDRSDQIKHDYNIHYLLIPKTDSSIEDLFPEDMYLTAVKKIYPDLLIDFNDKEKHIFMITKRLSELFKRKKLEKMDKYNVTKELIKLIPNYPECVKPFEDTFSQINNLALKLEK